MVLGTYNAALAGELRWDGAAHSPRRVPRPVDATSVDAALARVASDAVDLLTGPDAATLTACGAPGCIRFYLRIHAVRQWYSTRCGDRVRAARHYARTRVER
jgi:predicted RNA-binding Zn ribbon-like protein